MAARRRRRHSLSSTPRADRHIVAARTWWYENRPAAPNALDTEIRDAFRLLARHTGMGSVARGARTPDVRRIFLPNTRYFLYYRASEPDRTIEILGFWHASRGAPPRL